MKTSALSLIAALALTTAATAGGHSELMSQVQRFKPFGAFNVVVGDTRFAGVFIPGPDRCDVDVAEIDAANGSQTAERHRMTFQIAAGGRNELYAGPGSALAVACADDARTLTLAQQRRLDAAKL